MMLSNKRNMGVKKTCERIPQHSIGVELGVWKGESSELFLPLTKKLYLVDAWSVEPFKALKGAEEFGGYEAYLERYSQQVGSTDPEDFQIYYDNIYEGVVTKFKDSNVEIFRGTTNEFFATFAEEVDWVYVDASHSYSPCLLDLHNSFKIIRNGGIIFGDDYGNKLGVTRAVNDFVEERGLRLTTFAYNQYEIRI